MITTGEYGGIKGFRNVYDKLELEFRDENEARNILELARYANVHTQKPLTESELKFIYHYPDIAARIMTVSPFYEPSGELQKRLDKGSVAMPQHISKKISGVLNRIFFYLQILNWSNRIA